MTEYTAESLTEELNEEGEDISQEKVEEILRELEEKGVIHSEDGEHWEVNTLDGMKYLAKNKTRVKYRSLKNRLWE